MTPKNPGKNEPVSFAERINKLNLKRRHLIRPIQERPRDFVLLSIRDVASRLKTDPATVLRIVRSLGFESYREFKAYLHQLSTASATSLDGMRAADGKGSSLEMQGTHALEQDLRNLHALRNTLEMQDLIRLVQRIHRAKRVLLIGGDLAIALIEYLEYKLALLGFPVLSARTPGKTANIVRSMGKGDLVMAFSFRRGLRQTVEGLKQARANGAYCVGVTDSVISPVTRFSDEYFMVPIEGPLSSSYTAPMSFLNILLTLCAHYRRARTLHILKQVDHEQRTGYCWYPA
jgi:DNA-binding MurR/RpiR family transcriptional regulator